MASVAGTVDANGEPPGRSGWVRTGGPAVRADAVCIAVEWASLGEESAGPGRDPSPALGELCRLGRRLPLDVVVLRAPFEMFAPDAAGHRRVFARTVRAALRRLRDEAGLRCPVHVVVEGLDRVPGFDRFLRLTPRDLRAEPWGWIEDPRRPPREGVDDWRHRLELECLARLHAWPDQDRHAARLARAALFALPHRLRSLREGWIDLRQQLLAPTGDATEDDEGGATWLRGVWLTGRASAETPAPGPTLDPGQPFLGRLSTHLLPSEARLATRASSWRRRSERRGRAWRAIVAGAALAACAVRGAAWFAEGRRVDHLEAMVQGLAARAVVTEGDAGPLLASLEAIGREAQEGAGESAGPPSRSGTRLSRWALRQAAIQARGRLAGESWWPALHRRLLDRLGPEASPDERYEALRVLRMLRLPARYDAKAIAAWWRGDLARRPDPPPALGESRDVDLVLAAGPPRSLPEDRPAVEQAQAALRARPLADAVTSRWQAEEATMQAAPWRISESAGPDAARVFHRASGAPLSEALPAGLGAAAAQRLSRRAPELARELAGEASWVLGDGSAATDREALARDAVDQARRRLARTAAREWDRLLGDLRLGASPTDGDLPGLALRLSRPDSPLQRLVLAVAREGGGTSPARDAAPGAKPAPGPSGAEPAAGEGRDDFFAPWRRWAADPADPASPLARLRDAFREAGTQWRMPEAGAPPLAIPPAISPASLAASERLRGLAAEAPAPLRRWIEDLVDRWRSASTARSSRAWQSAAEEDLGAWCRQAIAGRYPFAASGRDDVPITDFVALFAPGGRFDQFVARHVGPSASAMGGDTGPAVPRSLHDTLVGAARVRDAFFGTGPAPGANRAAGASPMASSAMPSLSATLRLLALDPAGAELRLTTGGRTVSLKPGDEPPVRWTWPEEAPSTLRLELSPPAAEGRAPVAVVSAAGTWSLFRLLDAGHARPSTAPHPAERLELSFTAAGVHAVLEWRADSVLHPWSREALRAFRCPAH